MGYLFCVSAYYPDFMVSMLYGWKALNCFATSVAVPCRNWIIPPRILITLLRSKHRTAKGGAHACS